MSVTRIASKAGVSIATVSRVLNNSRPVNPKLAELVHNAVKELQILPRPTRRRNKLRSTDKQLTVAIVTLGAPYREWFEIPVIAGVVAELTAAAQNRNMSILMAEMPDPNVISPVLKRPDINGAFAFISSGLPISRVAALKAHMPVVRVMGADNASPIIDHVCADNIGIGEMAFEYLSRHECDQYAFITHSQAWDLICQRAQGFALAAHRAGHVPLICQRAGEQDRLPVLSSQMLVRPQAEELIQQIAQQRTSKIGLFISRDVETAEIYRALTANGLRVGHEVVVISCDSESVRLSSLHPKPASIDLSASSIAKIAVQRLADRIQSPESPVVRTLIQPRLVPGDLDQN